MMLLLQKFSNRSFYSSKSPE